ncbi:MAG: UPF0104 family protein [Phycisphaerales bacterium]|nr:MAG: UPF0104 family protein [Phycisphaerales bacterium]
MSATSRRKSWLKNGIRIVVCIVALAYVLSQITWRDAITIVTDDGVATYHGRLDGDGPYTLTGADGTVRTIATESVAMESGQPAIHYGIYTVFRQAELWMIALAVVLYVPGTLIQGKRFEWMLRAQSIRVGYWESTKLCWIGNFLNFVFAIGSTAGDVFKMYQVARHTDRRTEAVLTVLLDRLVGLLGLVMMVALLLTLSGTGGLVAQFRWITWAMVAATGVGAFVYLSPATRRLAPLSLLERVPKFEYFRRIDRMALNCWEHRWLSAASILATIVLQMFCTGSYLLAAFALHFNITGLRDVFDCYAFFGAGVVVASIPISVQGMGTMELAYKEMFSPYATLNAILCLAFAVRAVQLTASLPGGLLFMLGSYHVPTEAEVEEIEEAAERGEPAAA